MKRILAAAVVGLALVAGLAIGTLYAPEADAIGGYAAIPGLVPGQCAHFGLGLNDCLFSDGTQLNDPGNLIVSGTETVTGALTAGGFTLTGGNVNAYQTFTVCGTNVLTATIASSTLNVASMRAPVAMTSGHQTISVSINTAGSGTASTITYQLYDQTAAAAVATVTAACNAVATTTAPVSAATTNTPAIAANDILLLQAVGPASCTTAPQFNGCVTFGL